MTTEFCITPPPPRIQNSPAERDRCRAPKRRRALTSCPRSTCEGVERRKAPPLGPVSALTGFDGRALRRRVASRRSTCGFSVPGPAFPGFRPVSCRSPKRRLNSRHAQTPGPKPLDGYPVAPRGAAVVPPDRVPEASRVRGYEPRPQAPPPPRVLLASCRTLLAWGR